MSNKPTADELDALIDYQKESLEFEESVAPMARHSAELAAAAHQTIEALELLKEKLNG